MQCLGEMQSADKPKRLLTCNVHHHFFDHDTTDYWADKDQATYWKHDTPSKHENGLCWTGQRNSMVLLVISRYGTSNWGHQRPSCGIIHDTPMLFLQLIESFNLHEFSHTRVLYYITYCLHSSKHEKWGLIFGSHRPYPVTNAKSMRG
jgi:hypothetical protein